MLAQRKPRHPGQRLLQSHGTPAEREVRASERRQLTPRLGMQELRQEARSAVAQTARQVHSGAMVAAPVYYTSRTPGSMAPAVTRSAAIATPPHMSRTALEPEPEMRMVAAPLAAGWAEAAGGSTKRRTAPRDSGGYVMGGLDGVRRRIADELVMVERECGRLAELDHARLELHRHSFNRLLGSFTAYGPLFAKIKSVYDRAMDARVRKVSETKPKEVMLGAIASTTGGFDLNLQSIHDTYDRQTKEDRATLAKLSKETAFITEKLTIKQARLDQILSSEAHIKGLMRELDDWQHTLIQSMRAWEKRLAELHFEADTNDNSAWKKNQDIAKTGDKISNGTENVERKMGPGGDLDEKKAERTKITSNILKMHQDIQVRSADVRKTDKSVKDAKIKLVKMDEELAVQKDKAVNRASAVTPEPEWPDVQLSLDRVMELNIEKNKMSKERPKAKYAPSATIIQQLLEQLTKLTAQILEAREDVMREEINALEEAGDIMNETSTTIVDGAAVQKGKTKFLICHGRGDSVAPYLRATGRVKNKNFTRKTVIAFLNDYWLAKDKSVRTRSQISSDFLGSYIRNKHGTARTAVEWTYNMMYGLKVYSADPDCETFSCILHGELPEDAHHGQQVMITNLNKEWMKADKQNHGGRVWGTLDRTEFADVIRKQFPLKSEEDVKGIRRAVATDQPLPDIRYATLLETNANTGLQGKFLETLREQYISDVQQTFPKVEAAIRKATLEDNERKQTIVNIEDHQTYPYLQLLKNVPFFSHCEMTEESLKELILEMDITEYHDGDVIVSEGSPSTHAFILEEGFAYVTKEGLTTDLNCNYQVGEIFGELGLKQSDVRAASVVAKAGRRGVCRCIRMSASVFEKVRLGAQQNDALLHQRQMQYYMATKMASAGTRREGEAEAEAHSVVTSVKCIRLGFARYDVDMPDSEINRLLKLGLGGLAESAPDDGDVSPRGGSSPRASDSGGGGGGGGGFDEELMVGLGEFMGNIRKTVIKRFAKPQELSDSERRAQFLRNISDSEKEKITLCFNELDDSGDGTLDQEEIEGLLKRIYGMEPTKKQMVQLMLEMDSDGNGTIDLDEFISAMATVKEVRMAGDIFKWRQTFDQYDEDQSGELSGDELKKMAEELWDMGSHSLELMQFMIEEADIDGDGQISWPEFCQMMQRMMDADEKKLEMKRQRTIINAQGAEVPNQEDTQNALGAQAKQMKWDVDLGVHDKEARAILWKRLDSNGSNKCTLGEISDGLVKIFPTLQDLIKNRLHGARIIKRAFLAANFANINAANLAANVNAPEAKKSGRVGDGLIERAEFPRFIAYVEFFANLWAHFAELDQNDDGRLNRPEFESAFLKIIPVEDHPEKIQDYFEVEYKNCGTYTSTHCGYPHHNVISRGDF